MRPERRVDGILIEGLNHAGKSTAVRAILELGRKAGLSLQDGHCWLVADALGQAVHDLAFSRVPWQAGSHFRDAAFMRGFNVTRSAHVMLDAYLASEKGTLPGLVQDRHWFTQYCSNEYFNPGEGLLSLDWVARSSPVFDLHVYLTCSESIRRSRASSAGPDRTPLHRYFRENVGGLCRFDSFCLDVVSRHEGWLVVDTSNLSPKVVAERVLEAYRRHPAYAVVHV